MTIYLVTEDGDEGYSVIGIYDSLPAAEKVRDFLFDYELFCDIAEIDMNPGITEIEAGLNRWEVNLDVETGNVLSVHTSWGGWEDGPPAVTRGPRPVMRFHRWAVDEDHAIEKAKADRVAWLRNRNATNA